MDQQNTRQRALERRVAELRDFVENAVVPLHRVAADGTILWANRAEMDMLGYTPNEYIGHHISEFHADQAALSDILECLGRGEELRGREAYLRRKDGSLRRVVCYSNAYTEEGRFVYTRCFTLDVTEQAESIEAGQRLAAIVTSSEDAIVSKDLNGIVTSWNTAAERIFGFTAEEMVGQSILRVIPRELHPDEDVILGKIRRGERVEHFETERMHKDGHRIQVSLTISPVKDASGRIVGAAKVARDISDQRRSEEALRRAEKMAATGQLAASIAHEINNPMQALANLLALIGYRTSVDDQTRELVALAQSELTRMSHIARQMLSFYRETPAPVSLKITELLEDVLEVVATRSRANQIRIIREYETKGEVYGFPVELRQLFANLVMNAVEAIGQKGVLRIRVAIGKEWSGKGRDGIRVIIADSGTGIPEELRRHIFEPFFTTKEAKGTGLGLWVAQGVLDKHHGSVRLRSHAGPGRTGTVLSVFLPAGVAWQFLHATDAGETAA
ncbi:MAG TPA: PAS domain S-box protein [Terriglobales bacterium]|nr:PAS domain S-box protein [Terriglobales bacterium]